jgi:hypothetical protein
MATDTWTVDIDCDAPLEPVIETCEVDGLSVP